MDTCDWCNLSEEDKQFKVYESKSWSVFLSDEQDYIGRCILVLNRHCNSLSELKDDEWDELRNLVCKVEGQDMINPWCSTGALILIASSVIIMR